MNLDKRNGAGQRTPASWTELESGFRPGVIARVRALQVVQKLPPEGREYVRQAAEAPSRRVRSTTKSMSGAYPSEKMGATIGFESRTLELPAVLTFEHDDGVHAYFDQAPAIAVRYKREGRMRAYQQRSDFLVVRDNAVVLVECKPLAQIVLRNARDPGFYEQRGRLWVSPPLQEAAGQLGLQHEVWTEETFSPERLRNLRMLSDYFPPAVEVPGYGEALVALRGYLAVSPRASVLQIQQDLGKAVCIDHLYRSIARGDVGFDLDAAPLVDEERCYVYRSEQALRAYARCEKSQQRAVDRVATPIVEVGGGTHLNWDGETWSCAYAGSSMVMLQRGEKFEKFPRSVFDDLVRTHVIRPSEQQSDPSPDDEAMRFLAAASETDLRSANLRHKRIEPYLVHGAGAPVSRTLRRYLAAYRHAQRVTGNGFVGLIPGFSKSGNRTPRLLPDVLAIVIRTVNDHYLKAQNRRALTVYGLIGDECKAADLTPPSYSWFAKFLKRMPAFDTKRARAGSRGAYSLEARTISGDGVDTSEPDRPFERVHVDHTLMDTELVDGETSEALGRCWLTLMVDHVSRRILAFYLTFDPPSYRSVLMVMRRCVERHGRLPDSIVVDGGKEFHSVWFDTAAALYRVTVIRRPIAKARFGSQGERMFGTTNTNLLHFLSGNTQLRKNVRQMTPEVDPDRLAIWTLASLHDALTQYFFEVYDTLEHRELLTTPRLAFERGMERTGLRPDRLVVYNEVFEITTSPAPAKGSAKVQPDGVKIHYIYYNHPLLQRKLGRSVKVRYDPFNLAIAWAFIDGRWLRLRTRHQRLLSRFTERGLDLATAEWRKRRSSVEKTRLSQTVLIKFLKEILDTETLLLERKRAAEERRLRGQDPSDEDPDVDMPVEDSSEQSASSPSQGGAILAPIEGDIEDLEVL